MAAQERTAWMMRFAVCASYGMKCWKYNTNQEGHNENQTLEIQNREQKFVLQIDAQVCLY